MSATSRASGAGSHARRAAEVADIFIPLTRNENSAMTVGARGGGKCLAGVFRDDSGRGRRRRGVFGGGGSFRSGMQSPTGAGATRERSGVFIVGGIGVEFGAWLREWLIGWPGFLRMMS